MAAVSVNSLWSLLSILAIPLLVYVAQTVQPEGVLQVVFWISGFGLLATCIVQLGRVLSRRGQTWTFLLPGSIILFLGGAASLMALYFVGAANGFDEPTTAVSLVIALLLTATGSAA